MMIAMGISNSNFLIFMYVFVLCIGCSRQQEESDNSTEATAVSTITRFLLRYKSFSQRHPSFAWTTGGYPDKNSFYKINEAVVAAYIDSVEACGPLSKKYVSDLENHFRAIGEELARNKQRDSEISGLDYDPVVFDQDRYDFYDTVDTARVTLKSSGVQRRTYLVHTGVPLTVQIVRSRAGWQIDSITAEKVE
jgi:hypothetical protein